MIDSGSGPGGNASSQSLPKQVAEWFAQGAQITSGLAGLSYAFGWILAARFYGAFGQSPEEGGVTFSWLAIRAFLIGLVGLVLILTARRLLVAAGRATPIVYSVTGNLAFILTLVAVIGVPIIVLAGVFLWEMVFGNFNDLPVIIVLTATGLLLCALWIWLRPRTVTVAWNANLLFRGLAGLVVGIVVVSFILVPLRLADHLVSDVQAGRSIRLLIMPGVPVFEVPLVHVVPNTTQPIPVELGGTSTCFQRLGSDGADAIYVVSGQVVRVPEEYHVTTMPCGDHDG